MDFSRFCPLRLALDKDYATTSFNHQDLLPFYAPRNYYRPWCNHSITRNFGSTVESSKDKYKISLDVQHFQPDEVSVKVNDKEIIIEGKHEERHDDHGFVSRQFRRRYALPNNYLPENVVSTLSSDGVLTVIAEKKLSKCDEKIVPIKVCGSCPKKAECRATGITQKDIDEAIREANELISRDKSKLMKDDHSRLLKSDLLGEAISGKEKKPEAVSSGTVEFAGAVLGELEKTIGETNVGISELRDELAKTSRAATSSMSALKAVSESVRQETSSYKSSMSSSSTSSSEHISAKLREAAENI